MNLEDGKYSVEVELSGGSGRAGIESPTELMVSEDTVTAMIQWSSPYYDYMIVNDEKFLPSNTEGNSVFWIPVSDFDQGIKVVADTTAMSSPHEIEYEITVISDSLIRTEETDAENRDYGSALIISLVLLILILFSANRRAARRKFQKEYYGKM